MIDTSTRPNPLSDMMSETMLTINTDGGGTIPCWVKEYWTSRQRQASNLHEVSYRACYKPQLPRFFIERLTAPGDVVLDPFGGRGTTAVEAALLGRVPYNNDVNPLSEIFARPRVELPSYEAIAHRLQHIPKAGSNPDIDLSMFYHPQTLEELCTLRDTLTDSPEDRWIRMVATNRLTGHSTGFFSVYTLPPNQAVSQDSQIKINAKRNQIPGYRDVHALILKKSRQLMKELSLQQIQNLASVRSEAMWSCCDARSMPIPADTVQLTVTSPPFLDIVQYTLDNWLRCWFNKLDSEAIGKQIKCLASVDEWQRFIGEVFVELYRVTKPGGWVAFEVGEVRKATVRLEELVIPVAIQAGFVVEGVMINQQEFTKTANIWGTSNNTAGTNTNRLVVARKA